MTGVALLAKQLCHSPRILHMNTHDTKSIASWQRDTHWYEAVKTQAVESADRVSLWLPCPGLCRPRRREARARTAPTL